MSLHGLCFSREVEQCWQRLHCKNKDLKMCKLLAVKQHHLPCDKAMSLSLSSEHQREELKEGIHKQKKIWVLCDEEENVWNIIKDINQHTWQEDENIFDVDRSCWSTSHVWFMEMKITCIWCSVMYSVGGSGDKCTRHGQKMFWHDIPPCVDEHGAFVPLAFRRETSALIGQILKHVYGMAMFI